MEAYTPRASGAKKDVVQELITLMNDYPVIGAVDVEGLPAKQFQNMREKLRGDVVIRMTKKRLMRRALQQMKDKKGLDQISEKLKGMPALIFTRDNPFKLYKVLDKSKSSAPAKPGQEAPRDIVVAAGPTSFAPGPIIGQLGKFGIKAGIDAGKIVIKEDSVAVKEGEVIGEELAGILVRLGIEPMEIGLNISAVYENGEIFDRKVLAIDEDEYINNITAGARWALNLAVEAAYPTAQTIELLLQKVFTQGRNLAVSEAIVNKDTIELVLGKAHREMLSVKTEAGV